MPFGLAGFVQTDVVGLRGILCAGANLGSGDASHRKAHRYLVEPVNLPAETLLYGLLKRVRPTPEEAIDPLVCLFRVLKPAVANPSHKGLSSRCARNIRACFDNRLGEERWELQGGVWGDRVERANLGLKRKSGQIGTAM